MTRPIPLHATVTFPGQSQYVARAREFVTICLGCDHPCTEALTLVVSELVTNSIVHSRSRLDGGTVTVTLRHSPGGDFSTRNSMRVEVMDDGAPDLPSLCPVDSSTASGRGLHLVDALAAAWNCSCDPAGTTTTWAEVIA